ncbi:MAG: sigma-E processing peptidase SpoIIGA [Bacilli bacterium]|nr:sigma-E processing peptidase SpoIIGA [Bacilli bacterium]
MKIYIDLVLLLNFGFDLLLLFSVAIILRRQTTLKKLLLSSTVGSITILSMFIELNSFLLFIIKIIISLLMVYITFGYKNIKYTLKNLFYLYTSSIILGGFLYFLNLQFSYKNKGLVFYFNGLSINVIVLIILSPTIIYLYTKQALELKNNYSNYYNIDIYLKNGKIIPTTAFLDTGNKLEDPYKKRPIILLNKELITIDYDKDKILLVPYDTINNHGLLKCVIPDKIFIQGIGFRNDFLVGVSNEKIKMDGIDCILNSKLLERIN